MTTQNLNRLCAELNERRRLFFEQAFVGMEPPADIRRAAERITTSFGLRGICDPGYIANIIALETGRGDGKGKFYETKP